MLENLKEVILNLEKSLNMMVHDEEVELLKHPEYLEAMREVVQSINQVTQTLKKLEESYSEGRERDKEKRAEMTQTLQKLENSGSEGSERGKEQPGEREKSSRPEDRILRLLKKKSKDRRAFSD